MFSRGECHTDIPIGFCSYRKPCNKLLASVTCDQRSIISIIISWNDGSSTSYFWRLQREPIQSLLKCRFSTYTLPLVNVYYYICTSCLKKSMTESVCPRLSGCTEICFTSKTTQWILMRYFTTENLQWQMPRVFNFSWSRSNTTYYTREAQIKIRIYLQK